MSESLLKLGQIQTGSDRFRHLNLSESCLNLLLNLSESILNLSESSNHCLSESLLKLGKIQKDSDKIQTSDPHQHIIFNGLVTLEIRSRST